MSEVVACEKCGMPTGREGGICFRCLNPTGCPNCADLTAKIAELEATHKFHEDAREHGIKYVAKLEADKQKQEEDKQARESSNGKEDSKKEDEEKEEDDKKAAEKDKKQEGADREARNREAMIARQMTLT